MRAVLVSRRFNAGHLSHLVACEKLLSQSGYDVSFRWNRRFEEVVTQSHIKNVTSLWSLRRLQDRDLLVVWFPSVGALLDAMFVRVASSATIVYVFHEPFTSLKSYAESGFGLRKIGKIVVAALVSWGIVVCSHRVVLPSESALAAYTGRYKRKRVYGMIPLMFDDEASAIVPKSGRDCISYIGTVAADHAFDEFVLFAVRYLSENRGEGYRVLIATSSHLSEDILVQLNPFIAVGAAIVRSGRPLSNDEINGLYGRSLVVWNAYKRSMQSGVLPKAYMFGCPVIVSECNRSEFVENKVTGIEIGKSYSYQEILGAINQITRDFDYYSRACREFFLKTFYYETLAGSFMTLVSGISYREQL